MAFRRKFKPKVFYLPSVTAGIQTMTAGAAVTGFNNSGVVAQELTASTNLSPSDINAASGGAWDRQHVAKDLIIRGIDGYAHFGWNLQTAAVTPTGTLGLQMRMAIISTPGVPEMGQSSLPEYNQSASGAAHLIFPDIGAQMSIWPLGNRNPPGVTVFWKRTFFKLVDLDTTLNRVVSSFDAFAPSVRVRCHPRKRLRWSERLWFVAQGTVVNLRNGAGTMNWQPVIAPDLNIAARFATARRT